MHFANPIAFFGLLLIPSLIILFFVSKKRKQKLTKNFVSHNLQKKLIFNVSGFNQNLTYILVIMIVLFLVVAAARPQWGKKLEIMEERVVDIVVAMDVSKSMLAQDIKPNRIRRARNAFQEFVNGLKSDRVGIVLFAGDSFVQCPLTNDYSALNMFATIIDVGLIPQSGTNISSAVDKSVELYPKGSQNRAMVLITDGENLQGDIDTIINTANQNNIIIYAIGIGTQQGAPIPLQSEDSSSHSYLKDKDENIVLSQLDVNTLSKITHQTGGKLFQVTPGGSKIDDVLKEINDLEKEKVSQHKYSRYKEQYKHFVLVALFLTVILFMLLDKKLKAKFKLFRG